MMPVVRVESSPKGLPMASTFCPTCSWEESPMGSGFSFSAGASIFSTAMSRARASPTSLAWKVS